jgi:hypothetical protein
MGKERGRERVWEAEKVDNRDCWRRRFDLGQGGRVEERCKKGDSVLEERRRKEGVWGKDTPLYS